MNRPGARPGRRGRWAEHGQAIMGAVDPLPRAQQSQGWPCDLWGPSTGAVARRRGNADVCLVLADCGRVEADVLSTMTSAAGTALYPPRWHFS
jgi:hypothetical protein